MTTRFSSDGFRPKALKIALALLAGVLLPAVGLALAYLLTDIPGPAGSGSFGATVTVLSNGNFVVTDPDYDAGSVVDVGAVYLYNGKTKQLISTLVGSQSGDRVGSGGVVTLTNGNYVVLSPEWHNGAAAYVGAVTWGNGATGMGVVSLTNSLVGTQAGDQVGYGSVTALNNGNYVIYSPSWDNGATSDAGAVTWCSGTTGCTGAVSAANSLVGSQANDQVGRYGVTALSNGNYVVSSWSWVNGAASNAKAATWCSGTASCIGVVTTTNSLVGSQVDDQVGGNGVRAMSDGNYVVRSENWDNSAASDAGSVTLGNGATGVVGPITEANSVRGTAANGGAAMVFGYSSVNGQLVVG